MSNAELIKRYEKTYKKEFDSLTLEYVKLEKVKQEVKPIYLKGKETIKYIDKDRIKRYTDTICKDDVITLKDQLSISDSLISIQDNQIINYSKSNNLLQGIILEKDNQLHLLKNKKPKIKPLGIGLIGGYGTDFKNGLTPFIGVGISYNIIRL